MPLAPPVRNPVPVPEATVVAVVLLLVVAGLVGLLPAPAATVLAVAATATVATIRLVRLARADRRVRRTAALLDGAVALAGLCVAGLPLVTPANRAPVAIVGLLAVALLHTLGLLLLPGRTPLPAATRLREATDAVGLGLSLAFAGWMVLPAGAVPVPVRAAPVVAAAGVAAVLVTSSTGGPRRSGVVACRLGAAATQFGLVGLVLLPVHRVPEPVTLLMVPPVAAGALLTVAGVRRLAHPTPPAYAGPPPIWPRITAPAAIAMLAAGYHLARFGEFGRAEVALGLAVIPPLVVRELLTAADARRYADRLARQEARLRALAPERDRRHQAQPRGHPRTGLVGRHELWRALTGAGEPGTLLVLHLPGLAPADDDSGRGGGAQVLAEVARRLRAATGPDDLVAHLGGDEFAVLTQVGSVSAYGLAGRLVTVLTEPYRLPGGPVRPTVSIGLADAAAGSPHDLLRQADLARRRASQLGPDRVEWYDVFLGDQLVRRLDLERELAGAVARGELDLVYQPVYELADRVPVGVEALPRWRNPVLGTVLPAELIPVAADLGLLDEVGQWVLDRACRQLAAWSTAHPLLWMAVNVTPTELTGSDFVARVAATLARHRLAADRLVVEVGASGIDADLPTVVARLAALRALGVRTALDDFHPGHASLRWLRELPLDLIKVDPRAVGAGEAGQPLIDVVLTLSRRLGLEVVVEELEFAGQVDLAHRAGCRYGQGFALSRPAPAERVEALLAENRTPGASA